MNSSMCMAETKCEKSCLLYMLTYSYTTDNLRSVEEFLKER